MNRRGDETVGFAAERFMVSMLAPQAAIAFGRSSKMSAFGLWRVRAAARRRPPHDAL
jgi:hypothetical protein